VTYKEYMGNKLRFISMEQKIQLVFMKYVLETIWKQARIETLKVQEMEQLY